MKIVIGLGNPGKEYEKTRHNAGYMALDALAGMLGIRVDRRGFRSVYGEGRLGGERIVLAKPETYMNNSGFAVVELLNWFKPRIEELIVVYDDIDLPCGALRIRQNGSAGTHNGMRSIIEQLGSEDFPRVRIGIGKPAHGLIDHVLGVPGEEDAKAIAAALPLAAEAVKLIAQGRLDEAQTKYNYKPQKQKPSGENGKGGGGRDAGIAAALGREGFYVNPRHASCERVLPHIPYSMEDVLEAEKRLQRFAPLIARLFPETAKSGGVIESALLRADGLRAAAAQRAGTEPESIGSVLIKLDSELPVAGSVKARGGIYEVLCRTEKLALEHGLITEKSDYSTLAEHRDFFSRCTVQVGSTGNLGLSIGISASAIGYKTIVHMSADAKEWKKALLRSRGVTVIEYEGDYTDAVRRGRALSQADPNSYFVDDENSVELFMGYAVAALRLEKQLRERGISVDAEHPLYVYLPCGVGGAPGGITFGLKLIFGDNAHCVLVEPVNAPCMLTALLSGKCAPVSKYGLSGKTDADGLAVGTASRLVYNTVGRLIDGEVTVSDERLASLVRLVHETEGIFIEPSAATSAFGLISLINAAKEGALKENALEKLPFATHILWATGGALVPPEEREKYIRS